MLLSPAERLLQELGVTEPDERSILRRLPITLMRASDTGGSMAVKRALSAVVTKQSSQ
jgi:hypothetical protein